MRQNTDHCPPAGALRPCLLLLTVPSPPARGKSSVHCSFEAMAARSVTTGDCMHRAANKGFARASGNSLLNTAISQRPQRGGAGGGQHCHNCQQHGCHNQDATLTLVKDKHMCTVPPTTQACPRPHVTLLSMATLASQPKHSAGVTGQHPQWISHTALHHVHKRALDQMCCRSAPPTTWQLSCSTTGEMPTCAPPPSYGPTRAPSC